MTSSMKTGNIFLFQTLCWCLTQHLLCGKSPKHFCGSDTYEDAQSDLVRWPEMWTVLQPSPHWDFRASSSGLWYALGNGSCSGLIKHINIDFANKLLHCFLFSSLLSHPPVHLILLSTLTDWTVFFYGGCQFSYGQIIIPMKAGTRGVKTNSFSGSA